MNKQVYISRCCNAEAKSIYKLVSWFVCSECEKECVIKEPETEPDNQE